MTSHPVPQLGIQRFDKNELKRSLSKPRWSISGRVVDVVGTLIEAFLPQTRLGNVVQIPVDGQKQPIIAEVVGFRAEKALLLPFSEMGGIAPGCIVSSQDRYDSLPLSVDILGKVVDPFLRCLNYESFCISKPTAIMPLDRPSPNPITRQRI